MFSRFVSLENGVREVFKKNELRRTSSILNVWEGSEKLLQALVSRAKFYKFVNPWFNFVVVLQCCFISNPQFLFFLSTFFPEAGPPSPGTYAILCVSSRIKIDACPTYNVSSFHSTLPMNFAIALKVFASFDQRLESKQARKVLIGKLKISNFWSSCACLTD